MDLFGQRLHPRRRPRRRVQPTSGPIGALVTVAGANFALTQGVSTVTFAGAPATVIESWSPSSVAARVPAAAATGNVIATVSGTASNGAPFTVTVDSPPAVNGVTATDASGLSQTFTFTFSDPDGASHIYNVQAQFLHAGDPYINCFMVVDSGAAIWLIGDDGNMLPPAFVGQPGVRSNQHCSVDAGASLLTRSGTTWTLQLAMTFASSYITAQPIVISGLADDWTGVSTQMTAIGTWPETVSTPSVSGASSGMVGQSYSFTASGAVSGVGHALQY